MKHFSPLLFVLVQRPHVHQRKAWRLHRGWSWTKTRRFSTFRTIAESTVSHYIRLMNGFLPHSQMNILICLPSDIFPQVTSSASLSTFTTSNKPQTTTFTDLDFATSTGTPLSWRQPDQTRNTGTDLSFLGFFEHIAQVRVIKSVWTYVQWLKHCDVNQSTVSHHMLCLTKKSEWPVLYELLGGFKTQSGVYAC